MEQLSTQYFRELLDKHIKELKGFCKEWEDVHSDKNIPEDVIDEIRTTIGLTNLLVCQKLKQFGELIDDCEYKRGEKEITCIDLQGFWDMVFHEVEKIHKSFTNLDKCRNNNWVLIQEPIPKVEPKKKPVLANTVKVAIAAKAHSSAARQRLAEAKQRMMEAKKKMHEASNGAGEAITIIETNAKTEMKVLENGASDIDMEQEIICEEKTEHKSTLETVKDMHSTEVKEETQTNNAPKKTRTLKTAKKTVLPQDINGHHKRQKSEKIVIEGKENFAEIEKKKDILTVPSEKVSISCPKRGKTTKEATPLQCVTRSARRAMLQQQND